jgi:hypothetical protein
MGRSGLVALFGLLSAVLVAANVAGARSLMFTKPTKYRTAPRAACGRSMFYPAGKPGRLIPAPGHPGLSARASSNWSAVVTWRISRSAPAKCKTTALTVSLGNYEQWSPTTKWVYPRGRYSGTLRLSVYHGEPPSDTVIAKAYGPKGHSYSALAGVLVRR